MFKPLRSVSVLLLLCAMPAAISYAASDNGATSVNVTQQNGTCKGVVKDKTGEAVIGASVVVKGTTNGVITDLTVILFYPMFLMGQLFKSLM